VTAGAIDDDKPDQPDGDPWQLAPRDELALLTLDEVLDRRGHLPSEIQDEDAIPVGIRVAPVGFRVILGLLAGERHVSYSGLTLLASAHGLVLLATDDANDEAVPRVHRRKQGRLDEW